MIIKQQPSKQSSISNKSFQLKTFINRSTDEIGSTKKVDNNDITKLKTNNNLLQQQASHTFNTPISMQQSLNSQSKLNRTSKINKTQHEINYSEHFQQEMSLIQNYLGYHNKFKTYFKSKKFKKIYNQLVKQMPLEKSYYDMYMFDKLFSLNKHIKVSLVHKETSFMEYLNPYFDSGKKLIAQFYKYFLIDDELHKATKKVNVQAVTGQYKSCNISQFFYIIITFLLQMAIFYRSKGMRVEAKLYYEANLRLVYKILSSSTSHSKLRRKICQYLVSFGSFLIENRQPIKAKKILQLALKNCINLVGIIEFKLRFSEQTKNKSNLSEYAFQKFKKRTNFKLQQAFQLMIAIYLNFSVMYQLQSKQYMSFLALNQVKYIEQLLYKNFQIKSKVSQILKKTRDAFESYNEKLHVIKTYYDTQRILKMIKEQKIMKFNPHVGIYGFSKPDQDSQNNRSILDIFFNDHKKKKPKKNSKQFYIPGNGLIVYDSEVDFQQREKDRGDTENGLFQYTITMKNANGMQSTNVYNHVRSPNQKRALTTKLNEGQRKEGKKLSKFNQQKQVQQKQNNSRDNKKSNTIFDQKDNEQNKKNHQRNFTYNSLRSSKHSTQSLDKVVQIKKKQKEFDFLDELIDNENLNSNYFLYGKQFVENHNLLSMGKSIHEENQIKVPCPISETVNKKGVQYNGYTFQQKANKKDMMWNNSEQRYQPKSHEKRRHLSKNIVKADKTNFLDQQESKVKKFEKSKSLKSEPMNYKQVVQKIENTQAEFMKTDFIDKSSIYRLKCRSQMTEKSTQAINSVSVDPLAKASSTALLNSMKKQDEREALMFRLTKADKFFRSLKKGGKPKNLSKKVLTSNLFSSNETGIRLLKKLIYKHKKTLKITKPDLFVNYNKMQTRQKDIRLVQKDSYLLVQYQMCEQQTKMRIKQNMQQLISQNIRYSQESGKRVEMINKAINEFGISGKGKNVSGMMIKGELQNDERFGKKMLMTSSSMNHHQKTHHRGGKTSATDEVIKQIFQQRIYNKSNEKYQLGLEGDKFLTGNMINNPNLFLTSIKYKQDKKVSKKIKSFKNLNNLGVKLDSEQQQSSYQDGYTKNANDLYSGNTTNSFGGVNGQMEENSNLLSDHWLS